MGTFKLETESLEDSSTGSIFCLHYVIRKSPSIHEKTLFITLQRQFRLCIPFLVIARPRSQFPHSCVCERFIYVHIPRIGPHTVFPAAEKADPSWEYIIRSQTHERGNCMGLRPRFSFSGNICFKFSAYCLCSVILCEQIVEVLTPLLLVSVMRPVVGF